MSSLIYDAVEEALNAYASVFDEPTKVYTEMKESCGFVYGDSTKSQFLDFCHLNNLDPVDPKSIDDFQMIIDSAKDEGLFDEHVISLRKTDSHL